MIFEKMYQMDSFWNQTLQFLLLYVQYKMFTAFSLIEIGMKDACNAEVVKQFSESSPVKIS